MSLDTDKYRFTFAREGSEATLTFPTLADVLVDPFPSDLENTKTLKAFLDEIYDASEPKLFSSRLILAQAEIGQNLRQKEPQIDRYNLLLNKAATVKSDYDTAWANLWDDKVNAYLGKVKDLEELINKTISTYADQVTDLIKNLSDTALTAVATLIGTLVASLFADKFRPLIFIVGVVGYSIYLLVIQGKLNLGGRKERFEILKKEYAVRKRPFVELLKKDKVEGIEGTRITEREVDFNNAYKTAWKVYWAIMVVLGILVIFAIGLAIASGGNFIELGSPGTPTPTPGAVTPLVNITPTIPTSPK